MVFSSQPKMGSSLGSGNIMAYLSVVDWCSLRVGIVQVAVLENDRENVRCDRHNNDDNTWLYNHSHWLIKKTLCVNGERQKMNREYQYISILTIDNDIKWDSNMYKSHAQDMIKQWSSTLSFSYIILQLSK